MKSALIDQLVTQIQEKSLHLTEPKASDKNKKEEYNRYLQSITELRGRPLYYPYLSSGIGHGPLVSAVRRKCEAGFCLWHRASYFGPFPP